MSHKILLVDNDASALKVLERLLKAEGYAVLTAGEAAAAVLAAADSRPDLIVSDVEMPGMDGMQLCAVIKKDPRTSDIPVILLTGKLTDDQDLVQGIGLGADDYLMKPVTGAVLSAKIQAVLRRRSPGGPAVQEVLRGGDLTVDLSARTVTVKGRRVSLTRKEFDLLAAFLRQSGRLLKFPHLLESVWGYDPANYNDPHTVEVHVSSLRRKLGPAIGRSIVSVPGLGYRYDRPA